MTYQTAHGLDAGLDVKVQHAQCSMAKLYASEMVMSPTGPQIFGGRATCARTWPSAFTELRVDRIWEGTSEIQRAIIADQLKPSGASAG